MSFFHLSIFDLCQSLLSICYNLLEASDAFCKLILLLALQWRIFSGNQTLPGTFDAWQGTPMDSSGSFALRTDFGCRCDCQLSFSPTDRTREPVVRILSVPCAVRTGDHFTVDFHGALSHARLAGGKRGQELEGV